MGCGRRADYPGGIAGNSPAGRLKISHSPNEICGIKSAVPSGLGFSIPLPGVETPGYFQSCLRHGRIHFFPQNKKLVCRQYFDNITENL
jgi:hypothetical protein